MRTKIFLPPLAAIVLVAAFPAAAEADRASLLSRSGELRVMAGDGVHASPLSTDAAFHSVASLGSDRWVAAGVRAGSALLLVRGEGEAAERLSVPETGGAFVAAPLPLARDGELIGLAWLAGDDPRNLGVRFARWEGGGAVGAWTEAERVAGPGPGSQLALSGAVLADGSTMLVWSAFDGQDDEIVWSRRDERGWTEPRRVAADNRVPDVTPSVAPLGDGAVVAWNRFARGSYHVATALWSPGSERSGWSRPTETAPPGSVRPRLVAGEDGPLLLYRDVRNEGWTVLRIGAGGRIGARAFLAHGSATGEPAIVGSDAGSVRLVPPDGDRPLALPWRPEA